MTRALRTGDEKTSSAELLADTLWKELAKGDEKPNFLRLTIHIRPALLSPWREVGDY